MGYIFVDQGNMDRNFWEQGNSVKVNFGEHLNLYLRNKGTTVNFCREQGNMPPGGPHYKCVFTTYVKTCMLLLKSVLA